MIYRDNNLDEDPPDSLDVPNSVIDRENNANIGIWNITFDKGEYQLDIWDKYEITAFNIYLKQHGGDNQQVYVQNEDQPHIFNIYGTEVGYETVNFSMFQPNEGQSFSLDSDGRIKVVIGDKDGGWIDVFMSNIDAINLVTNHENTVKLADYHEGLTINGGAATGLLWVELGDGDNTVTNDGAAKTVALLGDGDDTVRKAAGDAEVDLGAGNNAFYASGGNNLLNFDGGNNDIEAHGLLQIWSQGDGNNTVTSYDGDDTIVIDGGGDNTVNAGEGDNTIFLGAGDYGDNFVMAGNGDNDVTLGHGFNMVALGNGGNAVLAGHGTNVISAGNGDNWVQVGSGQNIVRTGTGNDTITAGHGGNTIFAGGGTDTVTTGDGADTIHTGLVTAGTTTTITGGGGADTFVLEGGHSHITDFAQSEGDVIQIDAASYGVFTTDQIAYQVDADNVGHVVSVATGETIASVTVKSGDTFDFRSDLVFDTGNVTALAFADTAPGPSVDWDFTDMFEADYLTGRSDSLLTTPSSDDLFDF